MDRRSQKFQAGLLAAVFAAALQFVLWAGVTSGALGPDSGRPPGQPAAAATGHLCATVDASGHHHAPGPGCLLCPMCLALSLPGALPAPSPGPLPPSLAGAAPLSPRASPIPSPLLAIAAAYPRGPPLT